MKKKVIIVAVVFLLIGIWGYSSFAQSSTDNEIEKKWELTANEIENIVLSKAEQNIKTVIKETNEEKTTVLLSGKVSDQTKEALENSIITDRGLDIKFAEKGGVKLFVTSEGKDELMLTINLAKDTTFKNLNYDMSVGNIVIRVPENFDGKYRTKAEGGGEVLGLPETGETMDSMIEIKTIGNIKIEK